MAVKALASIPVGWGLRVANPRFWGGNRGVVGSPRNIIISYNVKKYEMRTLFKVVTLQNLIYRFVYIK